MVFFEMTADEDQLWTKLARSTPRHAAADSECFSLVRCGQHNSAANGNGFAAQRRIDQLFDRCIEGIEVGVKDSGCCVHPKAAHTSSVANPETVSGHGASNAKMSAFDPKTSVRLHASARPVMPWRLRPGSGTRPLRHPTP